MGIVLLQWPTLAVFAVTIAAIVVNRFDATVAALLGVVVMVWMGTMTEVEAAQLVDWNVMAILVGIWIIAGYFGRTGTAATFHGVVAARRHVERVVAILAGRSPGARRPARAPIVARRPGDHSAGHGQELF